MTVDLLPAPWLNQELADGRYLILDLLGDGGMAHVYRAWDRRFRRDVAVKALKAVLLTDPSFAFRFQREISTVAGLQHAHILPVLDSGKHQGMPFAIFPFMAGGNLADRLRESNPAKTGWLTAEALRWLVQVASALDFLHARNLFHRDVKPDNILFDADGTAFLSDFGVVRIMEPDDANENPTSVTAPNMVLGTCAYMAPELVSGETDYNGTVDQYSLAVTLYESLAAERPFKGTPQQIMVQHLQGAAKPLSDFWTDAPAALSNALQIAMAKTSTERFPNCTAFARVVIASVEEDATKTILPDTTTDTGEHPAVDTLTPGKRGAWSIWLRRIAVLAILFFAGGLTGALGALLFRNDNGEEAPIVHPPTAPETVTVGQDGSSDFQSITEAIRQSSDGARVLVAPGTYRESIELNRPVAIIGKRKDNQDQIVIESVGRHCITMKTSTATIQGLTLRCRPAAGEKSHHALYVPQGELTVKDCDIQSTSHAAVAIHTSSAHAIVKHCKIHGAAQSVGLYIHDGARATVESCSVYENAVSGITLVEAGSLTFRDCQVYDNAGWGMIVRNQQHGVFERCKIHSNDNINVRLDQTGNPIFRDCHIYKGGNLGVFVDGATRGFFENCDIYQNAKAGVLTQEKANPTFKKCNIFDGQSQGLYVYKGGRGTFDDCEIFKNAGVGVEINWDKSNPILRNCKIQSDTTHGVLVAVAGLGAFHDCRISGKNAAALVRADGNPQFHICQFTANPLDFGVHIDGAGGKFIDCTVRNHSLKEGKPAVYFSKSKSGLTCTFHKCKINGSSIGFETAGDGEGLVITQCDLTNNGRATQFPMNHRVRYKDNKDRPFAE